MLRPILSCVLLPVPLLAQQSPLPADFAALVPNDAAALVVLRSSEELAALAERVRRVAAPEAPPMSAALLLEGFVGELASLPLEVAQIDGNLPVGLAFALRPEAPEPRVTLILPARDVGALVASLELPDGAYARAGAGTFVGLTLGTDRAPGSGASRLVRGGPEGALTARVDLGRLIDDFGPLVEAQLDQAQMMIDSGALDDPDVPVDLEPMFEWYLELAYDLLDSAEVLDLAFDQRGAELALDLALGLREKSPLAALARPEPIDYRAALAHVDPAAPMQMVARYDQGQYLELTWSLYEGMLEALEADSSVSPEFAAALRTYVQGLRELTERAGDLTAMSFGVAPDGMRMAGYYRTREPAALVQGWLELLTAPSMSAVGLTASAPAATELGGRPGTSLNARLDLSRLMSLAPEEERVDEEEWVELQGFVDRLLGPQGLALAMLPMEERLGLVAGGDAEWRAVVGRRLVEGGPLPAHLERAAETLEGANPGMLMALDLGAGMRALLDLVAGLDDADTEELAMLVGDLGDRAVPMSACWGVRERAWRANVSVELDGLLALMAAVERVTTLEDQRMTAWFDLFELEEALEQYAADHDGALPDSLEALTAAGPDGEAYLEVLPEDPWGRPYHYRRTDDGYELTSFGADGAPGGEGPGADVLAPSDEEPEEGDAPFVYEIF